MLSINKSGAKKLKISSNALYTVTYPAPIFRKDDVGRLQTQVCPKHNQYKIQVSCTQNLYLLELLFDGSQVVLEDALLVFEFTNDQILSLDLRLKCHDLLREDVLLFAEQLVNLARLNSLKRKRVDYTGYFEFTNDQVLSIGLRKGLANT